MNINQVHTPERLDGETQREYRARQKLSKRLTAHTPVFCRGFTYIKPGTVSAQKNGVRK